MKVKELIEKLQKIDQDLDVEVENPYGIGRCYLRLTGEVEVTLGSEYAELDKWEKEEADFNEDEYKICYLGAYKSR